MDILWKPSHHDSEVQQTEAPVLCDLDQEDCQTFCNNPRSNSSACEVKIVHGLPSLDVDLNARSYQSLSFATQFVSLVFALHVPTWGTTQHLDPTQISVCKASGSLTNAVFFVSYPPLPSMPPVVLRIFGSSSGLLISRSRELHTLHVLSSRYHIGPRIYGLFSNGRIEEYFDAVTLEPSDLRDARISRWIGASMAEFHSVEVADIEGPLAVRNLGGTGKRWEIGIKKNVNAWLPVARKVLARSELDESDRSVLNLDAFAWGWGRYLHWLSQVERVDGHCRRVFAHNDIQCGNILRLMGRLPHGTPEHRQFVVIDFEYASLNPLAFDIANHFHEWTADYHTSTPHLFDLSRYPTAHQRRNFYQAYLSQAEALSPLSEPSRTEGVDEARLAKLDQEVRIWSPAAHGMWAVWGIIRAKDDLTGRGRTEVVFDHIGYAKCRMERFFHEIAALGVTGIVYT